MNYFDCTNEHFQVQGSESVVWAVNIDNIVTILSSTLSTTTSSPMCVREQAHFHCYLWHLLSAPGNSWLWCGINGDALDSLLQVIDVAKRLIDEVQDIRDKLDPNQMHFTGEGKSCCAHAWAQAKATIFQLQGQINQALSRTKSIAVPLARRWQCHFGGHAWQCAIASESVVALRSSLLTILIWYQCMTWCTKMYLFRSCLHLLSHCSLANNTCWQC